MTTVFLTLHGEPDEVDQRARELLVELRQLDVDKVAFADEGAAPPLSKGVDPASVSSIAVALASSPVLVQVVGLLRDWVRRDRDRKMTVKDGKRSLELTGTSADDNRAAIEAFFKEK
ncbi:hypothetical protein F0L68_37725 [Solihabitans fulvus]|uniref:Uncharacterized protein n=1 Tax=Solihabitans fulvus TaxID=1892852 RepID=A0A5B2WK90_9PSEU|nr:hypothetical protein [Solihabitans fulvus]KAA2251170.1 hypothetical protein F0L68_37725 [Solihabitans fulvus]